MDDGGLHYLQGLATCSDGAVVGTLSVPFSDAAPSVPVCGVGECK